MRLWKLHPWIKYIDEWKLYFNPLPVSEHHEMFCHGWQTKYLIVHLPGTVHKFWLLLIFYLRDHCLNSVLILGELELIIQSPFFLKLLKNHMFFDDFRGNRS